MIAMQRRLDAIANPVGRVLARACMSVVLSAVGVVLACAVVFVATLIPPAMMTLAWMRAGEDERGDQ